jgi:D-aminoacyl-tRNA deacylase
MNMRNEFLSTKNFYFKKMESKWYDKELYILEDFFGKNDLRDNLRETKVYLGLTSKSLIYLNDLKLNQLPISPDFLIFASRHRSETARPAFLAHTTGNWGDNADFGGNPREICYASALLIKAGLISLLELNKPSILENFTIDIEVTHHGPTSLDKPLIFMELGSSEKEWAINEAAEVVSTAIINTICRFIKYKKDKSEKIAIGFGGTHYAPQFKKIMTEGNIAISYICPKYYIKDLDKSMIEQMLNRNLEKIDYFIIDWKGTNSEDKHHLIPLLEDFNVPIKKTKDF